MEKGGNCIHLVDLAPGARARLCSDHDDRRAAGRLAELGFVPGTEVRIVRVAPFGDPFEVEIRGTRFCARREELKGLCVVPGDGSAARTSDTEGAPASRSDSRR